MLTAMRVFASRLLGSFRRRRFDAGIEEEFQSHLQMLADRFASQGMTKAEALRAAKQQFGGIAQVEQELRERSGLAFLDSLWQDLCYALRQLRRNPGFTAVAVLTLALGIGANTAIFSAVQTVLLRPYPFSRPNQLVNLWSVNLRSHVRDGVSGPDYLDYKSQNQAFKQLCAYTFRDPADLSIAGHSQRVWSMLATGSIFSTLGIEPALGRSFLPEEEDANSHVAMLSYALWQSQFEGGTNVLGRSILVDGRFRTVIGILPPRFDLPEELGDRISVVLPIPWDSAVFRDRTLTNLLSIARLQSNIDVSLAQSDSSVIASRLAAAHAASSRHRGVQVAPIAEERKPLQDPLGALFGAVSFVLLIACGNVSGLLLARGLARRREFAVRAALGAARGRLVRQVLTESILLAVFGGALGLFGAWEGAGVLAKMGAAAIPALKGLHVNVGTAGFAFIISLAAAIVFGVLPAWKISSLDVNSSLKGSPLTHARAFRPTQLRGMLVAVQVALAVVVLCGAGVLIRSLYDLSSTSPGFNVDHLLTADISKSAAPAAQISFFNELLAGTGSISGILDAAATSAPPLGSDAIAPMPPFDIPGHRSSGLSYAMLRVVTPGYFHTIGVPLIAGREFTPRDSAAAERVAIINDVIARQYFKNVSAVGQELAIHPLQYPARFAPQPGIVRIVGVVKGLKHWFTGGLPHFDYEIYFPYAQSPVSDMMLVARFDGRTPGVAGELQKRITAFDPSAILDNPQTMRAQFSQTLAPNRFYPVLLAVFAVIALVLASIGIYGVVAYWVRERTQEIGIRIALGARSLDVLRLVVLQGLIFVVAGAAAGLAAALALTRFLSDLLYGVTPRDPATFISVAILLIAVALLACYIPARRAMRVDPMVALRYD